jgi:hypothetical protein
MEIHPYQVMFNTVAILSHIFRKTNVYASEQWQKMSSVISKYRWTTMALHSFTETDFFGNSFSFINPQKQMLQGLMSRLLSGQILPDAWIRVLIRNHMWSKVQDRLMFAVYNMAPSCTAQTTVCLLASQLQQVEA